MSLHFHILVPDGVFIREGADPDSRPRFTEIAPPTNEEVAALLTRITKRIIALLRRWALLHEEDRGGFAPEVQHYALPACGIPDVEGLDLGALSLPTWAPIELSGDRVDEIRYDDFECGETGRYRAAR